MNPALPTAHPLASTLTPDTPPQRSARENTHWRAHTHKNKQNMDTDTGSLTKHDISKAHIIVVDIGERRSRLLTIRALSEWAEAIQSREMSV